MMCRVLTRLLGTLAVLFALSAAPAGAAQTSQEIAFAASDGVRLQTTLRGEAPLAPRPTVVEFSPYGRNSGTLDAGPAYNHLLVQIRGTGDSRGRFDALGPRTQADVAEVLGWACRQSWSDGRLALNGFSASAITIYNSLHLELPCVKAAVLKSGTYELYRDLLVPGAINNIVPGAGVMLLIGAPAAQQGFDHPLTGPDTAIGLFSAGLDELRHPTQDAWWRERGFRGDVNHLPILMVNGFFDVESRGAFEGYRRLRRDGAHLLVVGAHEGAPAGTDAGVGEMRAWLDRHARGIENGVEQRPRAQLYLSDGDREDMLRGRFVRYDADDWPAPGTRWVPLALRKGGVLGLEPQAAAARQPYLAVPSQSLATDPPNAAIAGAAGLNALTARFPALTQMNTPGKLALSYATAPLREDVLAAGPLALRLRLASTAPQTNLWAVLSDVAPDGTAHPLTAGRLNSDFPRVIRDRSLVRRDRIVQPYGDFTTRDRATPGQAREYQVELWPVGNRFKRGHRIRLDVLGSSGASLPGAPAVNLVTVGGRRASRLLFPVLPGSDLRRTLGQ
jgi:predicted acyl esterase